MSRTAYHFYGFILLAALAIFMLPWHRILAPLTFVCALCVAMAAQTPQIQAGSALPEAIILEAGP